MSLLDQSGVTGGGLDPYNVHALFFKYGQHVDAKIWKLRLSCFKGPPPQGAFCHSVILDSLPSHQEALSI